MDSNIPNFNSSASAMTHAATPRQNKPLDRIYDVFLSHRRENEALVTELNDYIENELHFEAYVDWKDSSSDHLDREHVTAGTANYLRTIMRHSCSLIFVVGENADLMTAPDQKNLLPDEQPRDVPREPAALFQPWLRVLRQSQHTIGELRRQLHATQRGRASAAPMQGFPSLWSEWWRNWLPSPVTANAPAEALQFLGVAQGIQAPVTVTKGENKLW